MKKLGFSSKWIELTMRSISSASFSVIINGAVKGMIFTKGIEARLLSISFSFHYLRRIFLKFTTIGRITEVDQGLKFSSNLSITHLLFVDDNFIFTRAKIWEFTNLKHIFNKYAKASGQIFNYEKSSIFFNGNTPTR